MATEQSYDAVVIGAGLGGLLAAARLLRRGQRVVVVERLAHPGGRFTAKTFHGAQVSTGAVHMLPFGTNGELAAMLRALGVPHRIHDSEVFASFHAHGRQYVCRSVLQLARVFGARQFGEFVRLGVEMLLRAPTPEARAQTFAQWLDQRVSRVRSPELYAYFERVSHFALSADLDQISYLETVATTKNMFRYGAPGIIEGGCAALTGELERRVREGGGELRLLHDVEAIVWDGERVAGVRVRDRQRGDVTVLRAPVVVSGIGPRATSALLAHGARTDADGDGDGAPSQAPSDAPAPDAAWPRPREASGLKVHLLSEDSIIPHRGIMYCLDTARIAGIVQPSNSDRRLAPPGKHLLITHQLLHGDDIEADRAAAREDLRRLFGDAFGTRITILTMSQYRGEWPVNRALQGEDTTPATGLAGLYLVGDAIKPSGYLMVEGVAQSVNALCDVLDTLDAPRAAASPALAGTAAVARTTPSKPPKRRAWHWLLAPPPPHPGS